MSIHLCYLACKETLSSSPERRVDAFEHDQMMEALRRGFEPQGAKVSEVAWDDPAALWSEYDAVMIGTTWDYQDRSDEFLAVLSAIESQTELFNPLPLVRWNSHKSYLHDLEEKGAPVIPTVWVEIQTNAAVHAAFDHFETDRLVMKRQVGACAEGQFLVRRTDPIPPSDQPMLLQPFIDSIKNEGEYSFIFIGGELSHALLKTAAARDYRIQSCYGGKETEVKPQTEDVEAAKKILTLLSEQPLYARVDMVRNSTGKLMLMELELIEPFLYPLQGPKLGDKIFTALKAKFQNRV